MEPENQEQSRKKSVETARAQMNKSEQDVAAYRQIASVLSGVMTEDRVTREKSLSRWLSCSLALNIIMGVGLAVIAQPVTDIKVIQKRDDGSVAEVAVAEKAFYELRDIKSFARDRAISIHTWTYNNYVQAFEDERPYWDPRALSDYTGQLLDGGTFQRAREYRARYESVVPRPAKVTQQMLYSGHYRLYRVEVIVNEEVIDIEGIGSRTWNITMDIQEVPPEEGGGGLRVMRIDETVN
ncbi:DotI/IcmL/TraM family protein [Marinobacterium stanieri]|uniref:Macrophage killing protein with similarity to conjugation protein n=1 Tax=Marinobacterium stanieri TaxID=49186 RepID=A0A1N6XAH4_9GAMM|nr:DotI/IcmL/TraM family protein [Marinobacterium stanieri]SIQ99323.1 Macrophage killing protein with similarity to conjugation protein [Marinobacterium stanieri]